MQDTLQIAQHAASGRTSHYLSAALIFSTLYLTLSILCPAA